jgi:hypothetical protein
MCTLQDYTSPVMFMRCSVDKLHTSIRPSRNNLLEPLWPLCCSSWVISTYMFVKSLSARSRLHISGDYHLWISRLSLFCLTFLRHAGFKNSSALPRHGTTCHIYMAREAKYTLFSSQRIDLLACSDYEIKTLHSTFLLNVKSMSSFFFFQFRSKCSIATIVI